MNPVPNKPCFFFKCPRWKSFENCGKRRNCSQRAISPSPIVFSIGFDTFSPATSNLKLSSAKCLSWEDSRIRPFGNGQCYVQHYFSYTPQRPLHLLVYPCFPRVLFTTAPRSIHSKPLATFPNNHLRNNE